MVNRRIFLKGLFGVTVALPLLESLDARVVGRLGRRAAYAQAVPRRAFAVFVRSGNGVACALPSRSEPERFWPATPAGRVTAEALRSGANAQRAISELADYADQINILKGVSLPFPRGSCGHAEAIPQCLTGANHTGGDGNAPLALGESVDWRIARALNPAHRREPLTLMAGPSRTYIAEALSWREARVREPAQRSPLSAYMGLVGLASAPTEVQQRVARARASVNDLLRAEMAALLATPSLGSADRQRLRQHQEAIRDTELRLTCQGDDALEARLRTVSNPEANDVRPEVVRQHMDVVALAFSCGLTHAATIQVGEGNDQTQYEIGGQRMPRFHWVSHRVESDGSSGTPIADADVVHHRIDRLQLQMFRHLLERLRAYPSVYGVAPATLLDDSVAVWLNDLGSGPPHSAKNVPWILVGRAAGALRTGNYLELGEVPVNRVLNTVLAAVGVRREDGSLIDDFGDTSASERRGLVREILAV